MAIIKIKDKDGNIIPIPAIKGDKGDSANVDVQINGTSIVTDGVANIPYANNKVPGVVSARDYFGFKTNAIGDLYVNCNNIIIDQRNINTYTPLTIQWLDYAVKSAMCDGIGEAWTSTEKAMARSRMGLGWHLVDTIEVTEEVAYAQIDFPQEYSEFMVIADIKGNGTSVVYPMCGYTMNDEILRGHTLPFVDFYPSTSDEHYELVFEKMNIENDTFLRMSGFECKDYFKKMKQNIQSTGWLQQYNVTNEHQCHCWYGVEFTRTITSATFKLFAR